MLATSPVENSPRRPGSFGRSLCVTGAVIALLLALLHAIEPPSQRQALGVPPTISTPNHPFDDDWLKVQVILKNKCVGCHRAGNEDRTDFSDYANLMQAGVEDEMPVVVAGNPEDSLLWEYIAWNARADIESDLPDEPMMPDDRHEWLTAGQLETIYRWIENGALEYKLPPTCNTRPLLETDFPSARQCKACHPKQYDEWSRSMHHYAQHSPIFEAFNLTLQERTGGTIGTFCSRCHTPIGTALGENGLRRNVHRSQISREGVTCVVCHRQSEAYHKSNARQFIQPGDAKLVCMFGPFDDAVSVPGGHDAAKNPFLKEPAFCGSCHDVNAPDGTRLEEAFSEWQTSPAARQGITCQQCHMGPVQGRPCPDHLRPLGRAAEVPGVDPQLIPLRPLSNHTFAGPDYSLLPDTEFPHKLDWMYEVDYRKTGILTPHQRQTLNELRVSNRKHLDIAREKRLEVLRNAARIHLHAPPCATPGERVQFRVTVESLTAGHNFPTGFTAERQVWVEFCVRDQRGHVVFVSGDLDKNGDLRDGHSHEVEAGHIPADLKLLNFQNKFINLTQRGTERSIVLSVNRHLTPLSFVRPATVPSQSTGRPPVFRIAKASLPPLGSASQTYPVQLPAAGNYFVEAKLNFRHLPPALLDAIGASHLKHLLEVVVIDAKQGIVQVGGGQVGGGQVGDVQVDGVQVDGAAGGLVVPTAVLRGGTRQ